MAQVPMPEGPRVNPVVPDAKPISILEPKESRITANAIGGMQNSQNILAKAANDAYNRMNEARATEAFNSIKIAVTDLMLGENGALRQEGSQVVDRKKPFVDDYMEQIEKISENYCEGLTAPQKNLIQERVRLYANNRREELMKHSIQQADAYQNNVAKTTARLAGETIATNARNIDEVNESIESINKAVDIFMKGDAPEVRKATAEKLISSSLTTAIEFAIENDNPEQAEALRQQWRGKGLSPIDDMKTQAKIRAALKEKKEKVDTEQITRKVDYALSDDGIRETILAQATGKTYDRKLYDAVVSLATEVGEPNPIVECDLMYLLGEKKSREIIEQYKKDVTEYQKEKQAYDEEAKKLEAEKKSNNKEPPKRPSLINKLKESLNATQKDAYEKSKRAHEGLRDANPYLIQEQILRVEPDLADNPVLLRKVIEERVDKILRDKYKQQAEQGQKAQTIYNKLKDGVKWSDISVIDKDGLDEDQLRALEGFAARKGGKVTTNPTYYRDYVYNPEALRSIPYSELYKHVNEFSQEDFAKVLNLKADVDKGVKIKDPTKGVKSVVTDLLERSGFKPEGSGKLKMTYDLMSMVLIDTVVDEMRENPKATWNEEAIRNRANALLNTNFKVAGVLFGENDTFLHKYMNNPRSINSDLEGLVKSALIETGYGSPTDVDVNVAVFRFLLNPSRPFASSAKAENVIANHVRTNTRIKPEIYADLEKGKYAEPYTDHLLVKAYILGQLSRKDLMERPKQTK